MAPNRLLAPYSDAMRLGMGSVCFLQALLRVDVLITSRFNSFTQELCIDDAVKLAGQWPLENNTSPPPKYGQTPVPDGGNYPTSISQDVTFSAKLVDRISQVTDSLNVSGPFQIKCDAGGGKASTFIDIDKFKESHINYLVQVLVTNQVLNAPNVTNFAPIPNLPESKFTRVYGDCFISGFTEGGEFNALISIKLKDPSNTNKIKAELQANFKATRVSGSTHLDESDSTMAIDGETTIAVSWKGGGNIRDTIPQWPPGDPNPDWTVQSVKAAAVKFPEHVMTTAIRTNAILTKYTSLKNFHEKTIKGAPLDYKNTGLYSSVLLDAYTDYKIIWRDLGHAASDVDQGQSILTAKEAIPELAELALEAKANYEAQMKEYQQKIESLKQAHSKHASSSSSSQALVLPEPPMPPNDCVPYKGNIFGLDKARLACRLEMIKIVREVDAVAEDPEIACDPSRASPYLNPAVFRMLLPTVTNLGKKVAEELAAAEAKQAAEAQMKAQEQLRTDLMTSQKKLEELEQQRRTMENLNRELEDKVRALELK
ncbi:hypothetical protein B0H19DRAFT_1060628 [Mycena capillaripes]|nr:hypothetical protein B0H19DRAFT_1060628 [Mycena capillaripes]